MFRTSLLIAVSVAAAQLAGCGPTTPEVKIVGASSPRDQLKQMYGALLNGKEGAFTSRFAIRDELDERIVRDFYHSAQAVIAFHREFIRVYGKDAWDVFEAAPAGDDFEGTRYSITLPVPTADEYERLDHISLHRKGDAYTATLFTPPHKELRLTRRNGVWVLDPSSLLPDTGRANDADSFQDDNAIVVGHIEAAPVDPDTLLRASAGMRAALERSTKTMESSGLTPRQLNQKLGRAMLESFRQK